MEYLFLALIAIYGVIKAFFGYKLHWKFQFVSCFFIGILFGWIMVSDLLGYKPYILMGASLLIGVLLGVAGIKIEKVLNFVKCFWNGYLAFLSLFHAIEFLYNITPSNSFFFCVIAGVIAGIAGLKFSDIGIIITAGIGGGSLSSLVLWGVTALLFPYLNNIIVYLIVTLILAGLGIYVQIKTTGILNKENNAAQKISYNTGRFCPRCGNAIGVNTVFCAKCGTRVTGER
jgi:hypothetical protein